MRSYIEKSDEISWQRPASENEEYRFVLEYCRAAKVIVPSGVKSGVDTPSFVFWISESSNANDDAGMLCLLEDFGRADEPPTNFRKASTYTILQSLLYYTRTQYRSILNIQIPDLLDDDYKD